jgi:hypothetical protein
MTALVVRGMHYIRSGDGLEELYFLQADPEERGNVAGLPHVQEALRGFRDALRSMLGRPDPGDPQPSRPVEARLRGESAVGFARERPKRG